MTENLFTYIKLGDRDEIQDYIIDNNQNNHFKHKEYHFNDISDFEDLFDRLNNLAAENEKLKQKVNFYKDFQKDARELEKENEQLKSENGDMRRLINNISLQRDEFHRGARENANRVGKLKKENEQLKSTIKEVTELLSEEVDLFSDKATEHDINAYVELKELDNKDAYYMATATKKAIKILKGCLND